MFDIQAQEGYDYTVPPEHFVESPNEDPYLKYFEPDGEAHYEEYHYHKEDLRHMNPDMIGVVYVNKSMSRGTKPGWQVMIAGGDRDAILKNWKKLMKSYGAKVKRTGHSHNELHASRAKMIEISPYEIDVYAIAESLHEGTRLTVHYDMGGDYIHASHDNDDINAATRLLHSFAKTERQNVIQGDINKANKEYDALSEELRKMFADTVKLHRRILDNQSQILEYYDDMADFAINTNALQDQINHVQRGVDDMSAIVERFDDKSKDNVLYQDDLEELQKRQKELDRLKVKMKDIRAQSKETKSNIKKRKNDTVRARAELVGLKGSCLSKADELHNQRLLLLDLEEQKESVR